jgi:hypothetical protein
VQVRRRRGQAAMAQNLLQGHHIDARFQHVSAAVRK